MGLFRYGFQAVLAIVTTDAAMQKNRVIDLDGYLAFQHPGRNFALRVPGWIPGLAMLHPAQRELEIPLFPVVFRQGCKTLGILCFPVLHVNFKISISQSG